MSATRLVYDGDCGFCTSCALWLERGGVEIMPWQRLELADVGLTEAEVVYRFVARNRHRLPGSTCAY